jgi:hypothetical protein
MSLRYRFGIFFRGQCRRIQNQAREEEMSAGIITVIIVIAAIVVVAVVAGVVYDSRRRRLRQRFGPEYDRLVEERESRRKAEAELAGREKRVRDLDIRPLDPAARSRYADQWASIQERFVDEPQQAVADAQRLVMAVMSERGYPTEGTEQVLADLSVEHARTIDHYRAAYDISQRAADDLASTEDLRQAMIHYRALFQDLLGQPGGPEVTDRSLEQVSPASGYLAAGPGPDATAAAPDAVTPEEDTVISGQDDVISGQDDVISGQDDVISGQDGEAEVPAADLPRSGDADQRGREPAPRRAGRPGGRR